jgi:hypothetical protein
MSTVYNSCSYVCKEDTSAESFAPLFLVRYWDPYYYRRRQLRTDGGDKMNFIESVSEKLASCLISSLVTLTSWKDNKFHELLSFRYSHSYLVMVIQIKELKKRGGSW